MSELNTELLEELFSPASDHVSGTLINPGLRGELLYISDLAYHRAKGLYGSVNLSTQENRTYLGLVELWLAGRQPISIETMYDTDYMTRLTTPEAGSVYLPTHRSSVRWLVDTFAIGCRTELPKVRQDFETDEFHFMVNLPLLGASSMIMSSRSVPEDEERPYSPDRVVIQPPDIEILKMGM